MPAVHVELGDEDRRLVENVFQSGIVLVAVGRAVGPPGALREIQRRATQRRALNGPGEDAVAVIPVATVGALDFVVEGRDRGMVYIVAEERARVRCPGPDARLATGVAAREVRGARFFSLGRLHSRVGVDQVVQAHGRTVRELSQRDASHQGSAVATYDVHAPVHVRRVDGEVAAVVPGVAGLPNRSRGHVPIGPRRARIRPVGTQVRRTCDSDADAIEHTVTTADCLVFGVFGQAGLVAPVLHDPDEHVVGRGVGDELVAAEGQPFVGEHFGGVKLPEGVTGIGRERHRAVARVPHDVFADRRGDLLRAGFTWRDPHIGVAEEGERFVRRPGNRVQGQRAWSSGRGVCPGGERPDTEPGPAPDRLGGPEGSGRHLLVDALALLGILVGRLHPCGSCTAPMRLYPVGLGRTRALWPGSGQEQPAGGGKEVDRPAYQ
jgi:hypothetical protein